MRYLLAGVDWWFGELNRSLVLVEGKFEATLNLYTIKSKAPTSGS